MFDAKFNNVCIENMYTFNDIYNDRYSSEFTDEQKSKLTSFCNWVHDFLAKPNRKLGRDGLVCPYTPGAIRNRTFWFYPWFEETISKQNILEKLNELRHLFLELEPTTGDDKFFKTIVIPFFSDDISDIIEEVQKEQKIHFVENGLMLGQFYEGCLEPGLWNDNFHPLSAPIPLLAIRFMVNSDIVFLANDERYFKSYLKHFANTIPERHNNMALKYLNQYGMIKLN